MRLDQLIKPIDDAERSHAVILEVDGQMVHHEADEWFLGRGVLPAHEDAGVRESDEIDDDVEGWQAACSVEARHIGSESLLGLRGDEGPFGVEDKPEGHDVWSDR